jgi:hypothetical protein
MAACGDPVLRDHGRDHSVSHGDTDPEAYTAMDLTVLLVRHRILGQLASLIEP